MGSFSNDQSSLTAKEIGYFSKKHLAFSREIHSTFFVRNEWQRDCPTSFDFQGMQVNLFQKEDDSPVAWLREDDLNAGSWSVGFACLEPRELILFPLDLKGRLGAFAPEGEASCPDVLVECYFPTHLPKRAVETASKPCRFSCELCPSPLAHKKKEPMPSLHRHPASRVHV